MSPSPPVKAVILVAGPQKGTRFRPLSLDLPKPLFPVAGMPIIRHHLEALVKQIQELTEVLVLGFYPPQEMADFVRQASEELKLPVRYLQEYTAMGTSGGIFHFRDRILSGGTGARKSLETLLVPYFLPILCAVPPDTFFVMNGDVCADFPLAEMYAFHCSKGQATVTMMATEATHEQAVKYGCVVANKQVRGVSVR